MIKALVGGVLVGISGHQEGRRPGDSGWREIMRI